MLRAFQAAGIRLPRVSRDQARAGVGVPGLGAALPGDMVFYGHPVHHVVLDHYTHLGVATSRTAAEALELAYAQRRGEADAQVAEEEATR